MKKEWYLQYWFICLLFVFSVFILPAAAGIVLLIRSYQEDEKRRKAIQLEIDEFKHQQFEAEKFKNEKQLEIDRLEDEKQIEINKLKSEKQLEIEEFKKATQLEVEKFKNDKQLEIDEFKSNRQIEIDKLKETVRLEVGKFKDNRQLEVDELKSEKQIEIEKLQLGIDKLKSDKQIEIDKLKSEKQLEIDKLIRRIDELKSENEQARIEYEEMYAEKVKDEESKVSLCKRELERYKKERDRLEKEISALNKEYIIEAVSIEAYENLKSDEVKNQLQLLSLTQKDMIKNDTALVIDDIWAKKAQLEVQKRQILRCFNSESISIIESVNVKNIDSCRNKLSRAFENINRIFISDGVQISKEYLETKLDELSMMYAYMIKAEEEKELQRAIREQMQEEEKVRREIEKEKQKIEKEESQFHNEIKKLIGYMQKTSNDIEKRLYIDKVKELEEKLKLLEKDKENVFEREQNTRAGYVYIISNIGSFGENIYKIGMTRRLEPMDRIAELSSASVPFSFDVHAMIFSDDAPALENILHQTFSDYQVNKMNSRKEFFKIDLEKIKNIVKNNHNATVQFVDIPDAVEYRESLKLLSANNS